MSNLIRNVGEISKVVKNLSTAFCVQEKGKIIYSNKSFRRLTGKNSATLAKIAIWDLGITEEIKRIKTKEESRLSGKRVQKKYETVILNSRKEKVFVKLHVSLSEINNNKVSFISLINITERKLAKQQLEQTNKALQKENSSRKNAEEKMKTLLKIENIIANTSTKFINISLDKVDKNIQHVLKVVGDFAKVDRSSLFLFNNDRSIVTNTHEWCATGVLSKQKIMQDIPSHLFSWSYEQLFHKDVLQIQDIEKLPKEASNEKESQASRESKSQLLVALKSGKKVIGYLNLESVREKKKHKRYIINMLKTIGEIIANALERKKTEEKLFDSYKYLGIINRKISILLELGKKHSSNKAKENINTVINAATGLVKADVCMIYKFQSENRELKLVSGTGFDTNKKNLIKTLSCNDMPIFEPLINDLKRIQVNSHNFHFYKLHMGLNVQYVLGLPLVANQNLIGVILLGFKERTFISTQELDFCEVFTIQASYLLKNSQALQ